MPSMNERTAQSILGLLCEPHMSAYLQEALKVKEGDEVMPWVSILRNHSSIDLEFGRLAPDRVLAVGQHLAYMLITIRSAAQTPLQAPQSDMMPTHAFARATALPRADFADKVPPSTAELERYLNKLYQSQSRMTYWAEYLEEHGSSILSGQDQRRIYSDVQEAHKIGKVPAPLPAESDLRAVLVDCIAYIERITAKLPNTLQEWVEWRDLAKPILARAAALLEAAPEELKVGDEVRAIHGRIFAGEGKVIYIDKVLPEDVRYHIETRHPSGLGEAISYVWAKRHELERLPPAVAPEEDAPDEETAMEMNEQDHWQSFPPTHRP